MNWFRTPKVTHKALSETSSILHDEKTFYNRFTHDLLEAKQEVIIESPYITTARMSSLTPAFGRLLEQKVRVFIMTRDPKEHGESLEIQSELAIRQECFKGRDELTVGLFEDSRADKPHSKLYRR